MLLLENKCAFIPRMMSARDQRKNEIMRRIAKATANREHNVVTGRRLVRKKGITSQQNFQKSMTNLLHRLEQFRPSLFQRQLNNARKKLKKVSPVRRSPERSILKKSSSSSSKKSVTFRNTLNRFKKNKRY
jgi:hypothetical protein